MPADLSQLSRTITRLQTEFDHAQLAAQRTSQEIETLSAKVERLEYAQFRTDLSTVSMEEVVTNVIMAEFGVKLEALRGKREKVKSGRIPINRQLRQNIELADARFWLMCLMRQFTSQTYNNLKMNFPWLQSSVFNEVGKLLTEVATAGSDSTAKATWAKLLGACLAEGKRLGADVGPILDELTYL